MNSENDVVTSTGPREWTWIDRNAQGWPRGEWDDEPDKAHWKDEATGLDCLAVRHSDFGHWCGYVGITEAHPSFGKGYEDVDVRVHGGLTFASECQKTDGPERGVCHVPYPGEPDRVWWLGFDCAHCDDFSPDDMRRMSERRYGRTSLDSEYRTLQYVKDECRRLAAQLDKAQP